MWRFPTCEKLKDHDETASYALVSDYLSKKILHEHEVEYFLLDQRHTGTLFRLQTNAEVHESSYLMTLLDASVGRDNHKSCQRDMDRGNLGYSGRSAEMQPCFGLRRRIVGQGLWKSPLRLS